MEPSVADDPELAQMVREIRDAGTRVAFTEDGRQDADVCAEEGVERIDTAGAFACVGFVLGQDEGFVRFEVADLCHGDGIVVVTTAGSCDERHGGRLLR